MKLIIFVIISILFIGCQPVTNETCDYHYIFPQNECCKFCCVGVNKTWNERFTTEYNHNMTFGCFCNNGTATIIKPNLPEKE